LLEGIIKLGVWKVKDSSGERCSDIKMSLSLYQNIFHFHKPLDRLFYYGAARIKLSDKTTELYASVFSDAFHKRLRVIAAAKDALV